MMNAKQRKTLRQWGRVDEYLRLEIHVTRVHSGQRADDPEQRKLEKQFRKELSKKRAQLEERIEEMFGGKGEE
jgi:hypothetical protein